MSHTVIERSPVPSRSQFPPGAVIEDALGFTIIEDREEVILGLIGFGIVRPSLDKRLCISPRISAQWFAQQDDQSKADAIAEVMEELLSVPQFCEHFDGGVLRIYCEIDTADRELLYCGLTQLEILLHEYYPGSEGWDLCLRRWPRG